MKGHFMSNKEINRVEVLEKLERREIKQKEGAKVLSLSVRQVRRLVKRYNLEGTKGLGHRARGRVSNNKINQDRLDQAIELIKEKYWDFGPTLAHEKLIENHGFKVSLTTIRNETIKVGLWQPRVRRKIQVHQLRERRACFGELIQLDGSPHDWFEGRGERCNLNVAIDDATGNPILKFSRVETTQDYFKLLEEYFIKVGLPLALYVDKHSIFRVNLSTNIGHKKPSKNNPHEGLTQFGRAMEELGVKVIFANTPQAKGRVEKVNQTLQDRLVKEMRLKGISSIKEANKFLPTFTKQFTKRFSVSPRSKVNMHRKLGKNIDLNKILCIKEIRVLSKNLTFQYNNTVFQIKTKRSAYTLRNTLVTICERHDGTATVLDSRGKSLDYSTIKKLPNTKDTNSKQLNPLVDGILKTQTNRKKKKNPWESSYEDLNEEIGFYKPMGAI
ncbi:MAG: ISNCY family transposase [Candidatus Beckwithbacteria bacterium]